MEKPSPSAPDSCPICLSKIKHTASTDPCLHRFCHHCILEWSQVIFLLFRPKTPVLSANSVSTNSSNTPAKKTTSVPNPHPRAPTKPTPAKPPTKPGTWTTRSSSTFSR